MARPPRPPGPPPERRRFDPEEAAEAKDRLKRRIAELKTLDSKAPTFIDKAAVALEPATTTVRDLFGRGSDESDNLVAALIQIQAASSVFEGMPGVPVSNYGEKQASEDRVQQAIVRLEKLLDIVDEKTKPAATSILPSVAPPLSRRVFLVHGHDEAVKQAVARVLDRLELEPIILHEQPDKGRTIMEKFEDYADVGFAVVLITGDDVGGDRSAGPAAYRPRARQNVLVEMGSFLGRLGRPKVCVLYEAGVELPSDYSGVLFTELDAGDGWKLKLAREIQAANIPIEGNRLLSL